MNKISKILLFYFFIYNSSYSEELMSCVTKKQSGLHFLGNDHVQILDYLGLNKFSIKLSRSRKEIVDNQNEIFLQTEDIKRIKNVHFLELVLLKSNEYLEVFHCSWRYKIGKDKISKNNFECIEQKKKRDLFSLSYSGEFSYSSNFELSEKKNKSRTLHSIFGKCDQIKN